MKKLFVVKFGGSCLDSANKIRRAAKILREVANNGNKLVVVVSAMKGVTDNLIHLAQVSTKGQIGEEILAEILSYLKQTISLKK